ncbi:MAG: hypothetical protein PHZ11_07660 [Desulfitobacteriaceae bacterium]|nr:hypothetical protein [Desulfitobacteriaceae bacterium]
MITAIGGDHERAHGSIRFTLSRYNTTLDAIMARDPLERVACEIP